MRELSSNDHRSRFAPVTTWSALFVIGHQAGAFGTGSSGERTSTQRQRCIATWCLSIHRWVAPISVSGGIQGRQEKEGIVRTLRFDGFLILKRSLRALEMLLSARSYPQGSRPNPASAAYCLKQGEAALQVHVTWIPVVTMPLPSSGVGHHQHQNSFLGLS